MPKIFEYLGILLFFYSNEHEPIHVHGRYSGSESKAEFYIVVEDYWDKNKTSCGMQATYRK